MKRAALLALLGLSVAALAFASSQAPASVPDLVTVDVTVLSHRSGTTPPITRGDVVVRQNGAVRPVVDWQPLTGSRGGVDLAVLVDDSLESSIALQWRAVGQFIRKLPPDSRVAVVYGTASSASFVQPFTTDRERAIKALRLPYGEINAGSSIYLSLVSLLDRWPADHNRRVVLLISDGIDLFYGARQSQPGLNRNLQKAIDLAQKKDAIVYPVFASGAASFSRNAYLMNNGQSCLSRLALETGGSSYTASFQTPVNIEPFLSRVEESLAHQCRLTFRAKLPPQAGFARLQLTTEQHGIELRAATRVYLPAAR